MSNVDKPDEVAFAKAIAQNLPGQKDADELFYGLLAAELARKALKNVRNR